MAPGSAILDAERAGIDSLGEMLSVLRREDLVNRDVVNLVASENRLSSLAAMPLTTDFYNRYFFNTSLSDQDWQFRGSEGVGALEVERTIPTLFRLARARHVNVRPVSGMSAMTLVLFALGGDLGSTIVTASRRPAAAITPPGR